MHEAAKFPIVLRSDTQSDYCNVRQPRKIILCREFYAFKSSNLMILFCEHNKRTPGVFKVFTMKTNQIGLLHRQVRTLSGENENLLFFFFFFFFYFCCNCGNKQHIMYRNFFESVYKCPTVRARRHNTTETSQL